MKQARKGPSVDAHIASLDAQLLELIEFVWTCEVAARREARIDAAIRSDEVRSRDERDLIQEVAVTGA